MIPGGDNVPRNVPRRVQRFSQPIPCYRHELVIDPHERLATAISAIRESIDLLFTTVSRFSVTVTDYRNNFLGMLVHSNERKIFN